MKHLSLASKLCLLLPLVSAQIGAPPPSIEQTWPTPEVGVFSIANFEFDSGETLKTLEIHYQTLGELRLDEDGSTNAVFIMHGSTGWSEQFLNDHFAGKLFNRGQTLDSEEYFIIMRDAIGHGKSSSPQNTGLHAKFPSYQYSDMNRADHQLLTQHFGINRTRLHMGVSMGGMQTWLWGEEYPDFMDALMPIACQPTQIAGHNRLWRKFFVSSCSLK
jgi:homoserine O-acetyltransferase/O-succinyltransferase